MRSSWLQSKSFVTDSDADAIRAQSRVRCKCFNNLQLLLTRNNCWIICLLPNQKYVYINYRFKLSSSPLLLLPLLMSLRCLLKLLLLLLLLVVVVVVVVPLVLCCQTLQWNFYVEQLIKPRAHTHTITNIIINTHTHTDTNSYTHYLYI